MPIWVRNIQLGVISLALGVAQVARRRVAQHGKTARAEAVRCCAQVAVIDGGAVASGGFFQGYTWLTWFVISQASLGGILVSLVMKYADNVIKGFATSLSIVISSFASWFIPSFDFAPSAPFLVGSTLVITATAIYSSKQPPPPPRPGAV